MAGTTPARRNDDALVCWGGDDESQATSPPGVFADVTTGEEHSCALRVDRTITCWGRDKGGQTIPPSGEFAVVGGAGGGEYGCAVRSSGFGECWGEDGGIHVPQYSLQVPAR